MTTRGSVLGAAALLIIAADLLDCAGRLGPIAPFVPDGASPGRWALSRWAVGLSAA